MKFLKLTLLLLLPVFSKAQDSIPPSFPRHSVEINPAVLFLQNNFAIGHGLQYRFSFNRHFFVEASSAATLNRNWDIIKRHYADNRLFPTKNQTLINAGYRFAFKNQLFLGLRAGYHYFQFGVDNNHFWITDVSNDNVETFISGFRNHSLLAGIELDKISYKKRAGKIKFSRRHYLFADYTFCPKVQIIGFMHYPDGSNTKQRIENQWSAKKHGLRMGYTYTQGISKNLGIHLGTELLYAPITNYDTKYSQNELRGGKLVRPLCMSLKIGITFIR